MEKGLKLVLHPNSSLMPMMFDAGTYHESSGREKSNDQVIERISDTNGRNVCLIDSAIGLYLRH